MCLRVLVPVGYMPASMADGWYLQWCPDGVAVEVLQVLFPDGDQAGAHAHHAGAHSAAAGEASSADTETGAYAQCDLSAFSADAHAAALPPLVLAAAPALEVSVLPAARPTPTRFLPYRSRAPPIELS